MPASKYDLMDSFELIGYWWLPLNKESGAYGRVRYEKGRIKLDLFSILSRGSNVPGFSFTQEFELEEFILGQCEGAFVTLIRSHKTKNGIVFSDATDYQSSFISEIMMIGKHFENDSSLLFTKMQASFTGLENWIRQNPFTTKLFQTDEGQVIETTFLKPKPIPYDIKEINSKIRILNSCNSAYQVTEAFRNYLSVEPTDSQSLIWFLSKLSDLRNFLTIMTGTKVNIKSILFTPAHNKDEQPGQQKDIRFFFRQFGDEPVTEKHVFEMMLCYPDIKDNFQNILEKWFEKSVKLQSVLELFFGVKYNNHLYLRFKFLSLIHALEVFDRTMNHTQYLTEDLYDPIKQKLIAAIPQDVPSGHRESLKNRIKYGNQASLRKRLHSLFQSLDPDLSNLITHDIRDFISRVVETRNFFTHYSDDNKKGAITDSEELYLASHRLLIFMTILILLELDLSKEMVFTAIRNFRDINYINDEQYKLEPKAEVES